MARGFKPAFAVVRIHRDRIRVPKTEEEFEVFRDGTISVLRVYWSRASARAEAARLNELNESKGEYYYCQHTRVQEETDGE